MKNELTNDFIRSQSHMMKMTNDMIDMMAKIRLNYIQAFRLDFLLT